MPRPLPDASNSAHGDANQTLSIIGVIGTLGTADTGGTALTVPFSADPSTGAQYVYNLGPAGSVSSGTFQNISTGTQQTLGTVGVVNNIATGTIKTIDSLAPYAYDTIAVTYPSGSVESYQYKLGAGTLGTITVTFTDSTKGSILSVVKT